MWVSFFLRLLFLVETDEKVTSVVVAETVELVAVGAVVVADAVEVVVSAIEAVVVGLASSLGSSSSSFSVLCSVLLLLLLLKTLAGLQSMLGMIVKGHRGPYHRLDKMGYQPSSRSYLGDQSTGNSVGLTYKYSISVVATMLAVFTPVWCHTVRGVVLTTSHLRVMLAGIGVCSGHPREQTGESSFLYTEIIPWCCSC